MYLRGLTGSVGAIDPTMYLELHEQQRKENVSPVSAWGKSDGVTISDEAREACANAQNTSEASGVQSSASESGLSATEEFSAYMKSKRSKAQGGGAEDRLKQLQDKLKSLQSQLYQFTSGNESSGADTRSEVENIQSQINATTAQIADAAAQVAEEKAVEKG